MLINKFEQIKGKEDNKDQTEKKGHEKRTRANTQKQVGIKEQELDDMKNSTVNMKQLVVHAEELIRNI